MLHVHVHVCNSSCDNHMHVLVKIYDVVWNMPFAIEQKVALMLGNSALGNSSHVTEL